MSFLPGMTRRDALIATLLLLAGCATTPPPLRQQGMVELEPLLFARLGEDSVTIRVLTRGCTSKADLAFFVERKDGETGLAFARRKLDTCKRAPAPVSFSFSYEELGLKRGEAVQIANPIAAN